MARKDSRCVFISAKKGNRLSQDNQQWIAMKEFFLASSAFGTVRKRCSGIFQMAGADSKPSADYDLFQEST